MQKIVIGHERAGDRAQEHHLFDDAAQHFQEALSVTPIAPDDRVRLLEKLGSAALLSDNPTATTQWRDGMLDSYLGDPAKADKAVETLRQIARQRWLDAKTPDAVLLCMRAVQIAKASGIDRLRKSATLRLVNYLKVLDRFDDARRYLESFGTIESSDDLSIRVHYRFEKGSLAAKQGLAKEAYENFERAVRLAKTGTDLYLIMRVLGDYASAAVALGDIERGKALYEQAVLVVRRNHMGWLVPQLCMGYASILARMGQYDNARGYLIEALSSNAHAPLVEERLAAVGIPLTLYYRDEAMLIKCTRPAAIDLAFQSGESVRIGPVTAAFARLYAAQRQRKKARAILHRALNVVTYIDECIDLPLVVAQHGALVDIPRARALLEARLHQPSSSVAQACMLLFDALAGQRMKKREPVQRMAIEAAKHFDRLHWYAYSDLARSLVPLTSSRPAAGGERRLASSLLAIREYTLTEREREVAALVLKGLTNQAIATELSISPHTVDSHVNAIMGRLGIRSRHQLADVLPNIP